MLDPHLSQTAVDLKYTMFLETQLKDQERETMRKYINEGVSFD